MSSTSDWDQIDRDIMAFRKSSTILAAVELGLFDPLYEQALPLDRLATLCKAAPNRLSALLNLLCGYGLFQREKDLYRLSNDYRPLFDPDAEDNIQTRYAHTAHNRKSWALIADSLRQDLPVSALNTSSRRSPERIRAFHKSLGSRSYRLMKQLIEHIPFTPGARVLDIGGGFGDMCRPFLEGDETSSATLFESPATIAQADSYLQQLGLQKRFTLHEGDFLIDPIPQGHDVTLLSSILHIYDEQTGCDLLQRLHRASAPGGLILIREVTVEPDYSGPLSGLEFAVNMAINTESGNAYAQSAIQDWLQRSGWSKVRTLSVGDSPYYVLMAEKAA